MSKYVDFCRIEIYNIAKSAKANSNLLNRYKKLLIRTLVNKVYLYDEYMLIYFNTQKEEYLAKVPTIIDVEKCFDVHFIETFKDCFVDFRIFFYVW